MKKILIQLNTPLYNAGVPNVILKIVKYLKDNCLIDVLVPLGNGNQHIENEFIESGVNIIKYNFPVYNDDKLLYFIKIEKAYKSIQKEILENKYDVIHSNIGVLSGLMMKYAYRADIPTRIVHAHGTYEKRNGKNFILNIFEKKCRKWIEKYSTDKIGCSQMAAESLFEKTDSLIYNSICFDYYNNIKKICHSGINLLQIGYYSPVKNQLFSLEILNYAKINNVEMHLYFIGFVNGESYYNKMIDYIKKNNLTERVTFLGSDYEKKDIFPYIDFCLMPSLHEGFPLVTLEAQAANINLILSSNITKECDMGKAIYLPINDAKTWYDVVCTDLTLDLNVEKILKYDDKYFINQILKLYHKEKYDEEE